MFVTGTTLRGPAPLRNASSAQQPRRTLRARGLTVCAGRDDNPKVVFSDGKTSEERLAARMKTVSTLGALAVTFQQNIGSRHRTPLYVALQDYFLEHPVVDDHEWLDELMQHEDVPMRLAAVRMLELRGIIAKRVFDWERLQAAVVDGIVDENDELMREVLESSMSASVDEGDTAATTATEVTSALEDETSAGTEERMREMLERSMSSSSDSEDDDDDDDDNELQK